MRVTTAKLFNPPCKIPFRLSVSAVESTRGVKKTKHNKMIESFLSTSYFSKFQGEGVGHLTFSSAPFRGTNTCTARWVPLHTSSFHAGNQQESLQCNYNMMEPLSARCFWFCRGQNQAERRINSQRTLILRSSNMTPNEC